MPTANVQTHKIGHVIRVGRGWADVTIDRSVRRVSTRPDLLVKAGCYLKIINEQGVALLSSEKIRSTELLQ